MPIEIFATDEAESRYFEKAVEERVVKAVLTGEESGGVRAKYTVEGRFTQKDQPELLSLVEGILGGQGLEAHWIVIRKVNQNWQIVGVSESVNGGFLSEDGESAAAYWMPPQILDFDHDGVQEVFIPFHDEQAGWKWDSVHVYRFDGMKWGELDWSMIVTQDNTNVPAGDLALPFRYTYQVRWALEDRDGDEVDEILMDETVVYYGFNEISQTFDQKDVLGKQNQEKVFKWAESVFEPDSGDPSFNDLDFTGSSVLYPWWVSEELPDMVFAEYPEGGLPSIHFTARGENERIVPLKNWEGTASFQVLDNHVYFPGGMIDLQGLKEIPLPGLPGELSISVSQDAAKLAWLFVSELEGLNSSQAKGVNATLLISNSDGDAPRVIWTTEQRDVSTSYSLAGWSVDSRQIYLVQAADLEAFPWSSGSGLLVVDQESGVVTRIGNQVNIVNIVLSPDEAWLVQVEQLGQADDFGLSLIFESCATGGFLRMNSHEDAVRVGNFSFSPSGKEVVWQEWVRTDTQDYVVIRGMGLEEGIPRDIREVALEREGESHQIGVVTGWIDEKQFVFVEDAGKGGSFLISSGNGKQVPLSPYSFLAVQK